MLERDSSGGCDNPVGGAIAFGVRAWEGVQPGSMYMGVIPLVVIRQGKGR